VVFDGRAGNQRWAHSQGHRLNDWGKLVLFLSVGSAFVVAFLVALAPIPRKVRTLALIFGPLADFGVFAFFISQDGPCVGECYDQVALGFFAVFAFLAWLVGAASGYVIRVLRQQT
jgi:hypothetical protein